MTGEIAFREIDSQREKLEKLAKDIWDNPEVAYHEVKASSWTAKALEDYGFQVVLGAYDIPTAIRAQWGGGHPVIGFLGEYDALANLSQKVKPEKEPVEGQKYGHACGHNILGVGHLAAAIGMKKEMEEKGLSGTVVFYGCPAEEVGTGKGLMAKRGAFKELDVAMAYHPSWFNYIFTGGKNGVHRVKADFYGRSSHAGSSPHNGRSALLAAKMADMAITMIYDQLPPGCKLSAAIADGHYSPGQIPAHATINFSMKAPNLRDMDHLYNRLSKVLDGVALATETTVEYKRMGGCSPLLNNRVLADVAYDAMTHAPQEKWSPEEIEFARKLNETTPLPYQMKLEEAGAKGSDMQIFEGVLPLRVFDTNGCTDVGDVSYVVPTIFFKACTYAMGTNGHTWQACACAGSSIGMKGMIFAAKTLALAGLKVMGDPSIVQKAKEEFDRETEGKPYVSSLPDDYDISDDSEP